VKSTGRKKNAEMKIMRQLQMTDLTAKREMFTKKIHYTSDIYIQFIRMSRVQQ